MFQFIANSSSVASEIDALLLFAAAVDYAETGAPFAFFLYKLKLIILNDLEISDQLSPETVRLLCCSRFEYIDQDYRSIEGEGAAPRWFRREGGDITIDNIDTP